jgi:hypothetical protein
MPDEMVTFNGVLVAAGWPDRIAEAQDEAEYDIADRMYPRVRYGEERRPWPAGPCHDCAVLRGQFHVPGCDAEECPCCHWQAIGCPCISDEGSPDPEPMAGPES